MVGQNVLFSGYLIVVNCNNCEKSFKTEHGLNIHRGKVHNDLKSEVVCDNCEDKFEILNRRKRQLDEDNYNYYCSDNCKEESFKERYETEKSACVNCNSEIEHPPSRERKFCSLDCKYSYGREKVKCQNCGEIFNIRKSRDRKYCSLECSKEGEQKFRRQRMLNNNPAFDGLDKNWINKISSSLKGRNFTDQHIENISRNVPSGNNHPHWEGGVSLPYGNNWKEQREKAIERDNETCQKCGMSRKNHYKLFKKDLAVDHIKPRRKFIDEDGDFDEKDANKLSNLRTYCFPCHAKVEHKK